MLADSHTYLIDIQNFIKIGPGISKEFGNKQRQCEWEFYIYEYIITSKTIFLQLIGITNTHTAKSKF